MPGPAANCAAMVARTLGAVLHSSTCVATAATGRAWRPRGAVRARVRTGRARRRRSGRRSRGNARPCGRHRRRSNGHCPRRTASRTSLRFRSPRHRSPDRSGCNSCAAQRRLARACGAPRWPRPLRARHRDRSARWRTDVAAVEDVLMLGTGRPRSGPGTRAIRARCGRGHLRNRRVLLVDALVSRTATQACPTCRMPSAMRALCPSWKGL